MRAFTPYNWAYEGKLKKKKFKKLYSGTHRNPKYYSDLRVEMIDDNNTFSITLKNDTGFIQFNARLHYANAIQPEAQTTIVSAAKYKRYIKALSKKRTMVNKSIIARNEMVASEIRKAENKAWIDFQKMYMTNEERKLSRAQWLKYYESVIANRNKAIASATATSDNMKQFLDLNDYKPLNLAQQIQTDSSYKVVQVAFYDSLHHRLADASVLLIDPLSKTYSRFRGEYGVKRAELSISSNPNYQIYIELMNGDIALSSAKNIYDMLENRKSQSELKCETVSKKLATTGMVATYLGL